MTITAVEVEQIKRAAGDPRILPAILHRWSPRSFDPSRDVSLEDLRTLFEAARWAASSSNEQPWRYLVGWRGSETYRKIFECLVEANQAWAGSAAVLVLGTARKTFAKNDNPNGYALHDLGAADATLCYQATALGLHSHQMAGFDQAAARRLFGIPEDYLLGSVNAIGYLGDPGALTIEYQRNSETAPRTRKQLDEIALAEWGQPLDLG